MEDTMEQEHQLFMLQHASYCNAKEQGIPCFDDCAMYKALWEHIVKCDGGCNDCDVARDLLRYCQSRPDLRRFLDFAVDAGVLSDKDGKEQGGPRGTTTDKTMVGSLDDKTVEQNTTSPQVEVTTTYEAPRGSLPRKVTPDPTKPTSSFDSTSHDNLSPPCLHKPTRELVIETANPSIRYTITDETVANRAVSGNRIIPTSPLRFGTRGQRVAPDELDSPNTKAHRLDEKTVTQNHKQNFGRAVFVNRIIPMSPIRSGTHGKRVPPDDLDSPNTKVHRLDENTVTQNHVTIGNRIIPASPIRSGTRGKRVAPDALDSPNIKVNRLDEKTVTQNHEQIFGKVALRSSLPPDFPVRRLADPPLMDETIRKECVQLFQDLQNDDFNCLFDSDKESSLLVYSIQKNLHHPEGYMILLDFEMDVSLAIQKARSRFHTDTMERCARRLERRFADLLTKLHERLVNHDTADHVVEKWYKIILKRGNTCTMQELTERHLLQSIDSGMMLFRNENYPPSEGEDASPTEEEMVEATLPDQADVVGPPSTDLANMFARHEALSEQEQEQRHRKRLSEALGRRRT